MLNHQQIKQELWSYIERLPEQKLRLLLSWVKLFLLKEEPMAEPTNQVGLSQLKILQALDQIRTKIEQKHGVYHGDMLAEVRAEREDQFDAVHRWANQ